MKVSCPCCHAELSLDALLSHEQARRAVARLAQVSLPFGARTLAYMALFKPASRALSIDRIARLIEELLPDIERQAITRHGREWDAGIETWRAALDVVLGMRDAGTLRLPLQDHGLLYQVMVNMGEKIEAQRERDAIAQGRQHRPIDRDAQGPRNLGDIAADAAAAPAVPVPASGPLKPTITQREMLARIEAHRQRVAAQQQPPSHPEQEVNP